MSYNHARAHHDIARWRTYRRRAAGRHADHYLVIAEKYNQPTAVHYAALKNEMDNLLTAVDNANRTEQWETVCRFAWAIGTYGDGILYADCRWPEMRRLLSQAQKAAKQNGRREEEAAFAMGQALIVSDTNNWETHHTFCYQLWRKYADIESFVTNMCLHLGNVAQTEGDYHEAERLYTLAYDKAMAQESYEVAAMALHNTGLIEQQRGDLSQARVTFQQILYIGQESGVQSYEAMAYQQLGVLERDAGNYAAAETCYKKCLSIQESLGNRPNTAYTLGRLGNLAWAKNKFSQAAQFLEDSRVIVEETGDKATLAKLLCESATLHLLKGDLPAAYNTYKQSQAMFTESGHLAEVAGTQLPLHIITGLSWFLALFGAASGYLAGQEISTIMGIFAGIIGLLLGLLSRRHIIFYTLSFGFIAGTLFYDNIPFIEHDWLQGLIAALIGMVISRQYLFYPMRLGLLPWLHKLPIYQTQQKRSYNKLQSMAINRRTDSPFYDLSRRLN